MGEYIASVFISHAHADKPVARELAYRLDELGCRIWIDEGELRIGDSLIDRISEAINQVDFLVALVTTNSVGSEWCRKELSLAMAGEIEQRVAVVLPLRVDDSPMPAALKDKFYLDVRGMTASQAAEKVMTSIRDHLNPPSPLPPKKARGAARLARHAAPDQPFEPIKIVGIDEAGVTLPRDDGTRGSALYEVPFVLSRPPDSRWAELVIRHWDRPARFTTMHRPGIARVEGARFVLGRTTMDEVMRHLFETVKLAVDAANAEYAVELDRERARREQRARAADAHREDVRAAIERLSFE